MKKINYRTVFYWIIVTPFILLTISHYEVVFFKREVISTFSKIISWGIGISIDVGFMFFLWFYQRIKNKNKTVFLLIYLTFIYFFQYKYYAITEPLIFDRIIFSAFFPFMLGVFAFMGKNLENIKNDIGKVEVEDEDDPDIKMLREMGIDIQKPIRNQDQDHNHNHDPQVTVTNTKTHTHTHTKTRSKSVTYVNGSPRVALTKLDNGDFQCPFCKIIGSSPQQLNGMGHNAVRCFEQQQQKEVVNG